MKNTVLEKLFWVSGWTYDFTKIATIFLMIGLLSHYFFFSVLIVRGKSMEPNYVDGDVVGVNKIAYIVSTPKRGDVIAMFFPGETQKRFIKRVIGLPGETIRIADGLVYVNGTLLVEGYLSPELLTIPNLERKLVEGEYFVLGDNRVASSDSRAWGAVPESFIIGKALVNIAKLPSRP
jgi:signal peptidase I